MKDEERPTISEIDGELKRLKQAKKRRKVLLIIICVLLAAIVAAALYVAINYPGALWGWIEQLIGNS